MIPKVSQAGVKHGSSLMMQANRLPRMQGNLRIVKGDVYQMASLPPAVEGRYLPTSWLHDMSDAVCSSCECQEGLDGPSSALSATRCGKIYRQV